MILRKKTMDFKHMSNVITILVDYNYELKSVNTACLNKPIVIFIEFLGKMFRQIMLSTEYRS